MDGNLLRLLEKRNFFIRYLNSFIDSSNVTVGAALAVFHHSLSQNEGSISPIYLSKIVICRSWIMKKKKKNFSCDSGPIWSSETPLWGGGRHQTSCDKSAFLCCLLSIMAGCVFLPQRPQLVCNWSINALALWHTCQYILIGLCLLVPTAGARAAEEERGRRDSRQVGKQAFCNSATRPIRGTESVA